MIWYLLYPLRGSSNPVTLHGDHYIRKAISRFGSVITRHSLATIFVAVAIGVFLSAPVPFLYYEAFSTNGPRTPNHSWTSAESFANSEGLIPDISIKQAWIYGGWMKALERETLLEALAIQDILLGQVLSCNTGPEVAIPFLHSPLLYWNCSATVIESDDSILTTINSYAHQASQANITLRPSSVLSGILLSSNRPVAADALVVSLFYKAESRVGVLWDGVVEGLGECNKSRWEVLSAADRGTKSVLFKFESRPISAQDEAIFFGSYSLVLLYVVFSLRNVRTLKSRVGLFVVIAVQECVSILSSFTLATSLGIDVWNIPSEAYPFIVLVVGLENMFRLVNEVERTPLKDQSIFRVATALGSVGHLSLIAVAQNLVILWLVSTVAPPGLAEFCRFAEICLIVDLLLHFTFFVSVLNMGLRKYGLQDSLEEQQRDITRRPRHAVLRYPRVMSTVVIVSFLFILSWHFLSGWITIPWTQDSTIISDWNRFKSTRIRMQGFNPVPGKPTDSVNWLKLQEYETIMEILRVVNPGSYSFSARVYKPLVIVLNSSNRHSLASDNILAPSPMDTSVFGPFWASALLFCGTAAMLMTLWSCFSMNGSPENTENDNYKSETISSVQRLPRGHSLDVFIIVTSSNRGLASVGFDHEIRVWNLESRNTASQLVPIPQRHILWPVETIAIDTNAEWLAICSKPGTVSFWNARLQRFGRSINIHLDARIVTCYFASTSQYGSVHTVTRLLLVDATGCLTDIEVETGNVTTHQICTNEVQSSHLSSHRRMPLRLITISRDNMIYVTARRDDRWISHALNLNMPTLNPLSRLRFTIIPDLRMVSLVLNMDTGKLYLIDLLSGATIYTFRPTPFNHLTLRVIHSPPQKCLSCGAVALMSFSIAYSEEHDGPFTMVTLNAEPNARLRTGLICLRAERDVRERRCMGFEGATEKMYDMPHAGVWEATGANGVAGVRRKRQVPRSVSEKSTKDGTLFRRKAHISQNDAKTGEEAWEAWTMTATGIISIHPLEVGLFTKKAGPMCSIGRNAVAMGLAEDIIIVQFGKQLRDDDDDDDAAVRKPPRSRLAGRSRIGPTERI